MTRSPLIRLHHSKLIIDSFAGGGGASMGIELALGRSPDIAINHNADAIRMHAANHPRTKHYCEDVWAVDPVKACGGSPVGLMWLSPDCKHFSKAKGGKPVEKKIRGLAWIAVRWAKAVRPEVIVLENVEEFQDWGPLQEDGRPCPLRKGLTFRRFVRQLENLGYQVQHRELIAADYGTPTSRKRLFLIARCDGLPIIWPEPTHGKGRAQPWRTAAECIDFTLPCPSIFERKRPLAENTLRRIAKGVRKYVIDAAEPFIVGIDNASNGGRDAWPSSAPLTTITAEARHALVVPTMITTGYGERPGQSPRVPGLDKPLGTIVSGQKHALVTAFLAKHYGGVIGQPLDKALGTITAVDHHSLVTVSHTGQHREQVSAFLMKYYGTDQDPQMGLPLHTITTKDRFGLVMVHGQPHYIADIGMRMLAPRELFRAQGFPETYRIEADADGKPFTKSQQVRMCGNSVCPPLAEAIVRAQFSAPAMQWAA